MKQSQVKPGVRALLSLGRRGAVAVTVVRRAMMADESAVAWVCETSSGKLHTATARQLRPLPVTDASGKLIGYAGADGGTYPVLPGPRFTAQAVQQYTSDTAQRSGPWARRSRD